MVQGIRDVVNKGDHVEFVNEVLTMHMGPEFILANLSVDFVDEASALEVEKSIEKMDRQIKQAFPFVKRIFIETEKRKSRHS